MHIISRAILVCFQLLTGHDALRRSTVLLSNPQNALKVGPKKRVPGQNIGSNEVV